MPRPLALKDPVYKSQYPFNARNKCSLFLILHALRSILSNSCSEPVIERVSPGPPPVHDIRDAGTSKREIKTQTFDKKLGSLAISFLECELMIITIAETS